MRVAWELGPVLECVRVEEARWNGWAVPVMNREQVEALVEAQPATDGDVGAEKLRLDGDALVVWIEDQGGTDEYRVEPVNGEYALDLGWTFLEYEDCPWLEAL